MPSNGSSLEAANEGNCDLEGKRKGEDMVAFYK